MHTRLSHVVIPTAAAMVIALVAFSLGNWQSRRADEKTALKQAVEQARQLPPIGVEQIAPEIFDRRLVRLTGRWQSEKTIYIDNRTYKGTAGFHVLTPLKISDGVVLVLRGWVKRDVQDRTKLPDIDQGPPSTDNVTIVGFAQAELQQSYALGEQPKYGANDRLWQSATIASFGQWSGLALKPYVIRQIASNDSDELVRDWAIFNVDVGKHQGYALQWYSLSGLSIALWIWFVGLRKFRKKQVDDDRS